MGSVLDYIDCPNCGQEASSDFYYKTGEEYVNCSHCGYHYSAVIKNRDKKLSELVNSDWEITELKNPKGAFRIKEKDNVGYLCGSFSSTKQIVEFKDNVTANKDTIEHCEISRFVRGKIKVETLVK